MINLTIRLQSNILKEIFTILIKDILICQKRFKKDLTKEVDLIVKQYEIIKEYLTYDYAIVAWDDKEQTISIIDTIKGGYGHIFRIDNTDVYQKFVYLCELRGKVSYSDCFRHRNVKLGFPIAERRGNRIIVVDF